MPRFTFDSEAFGKAFAVAKVVQPASKDFAMKFHGNRLIIYSSDKRRFSRAEVVADRFDDVDESYESGEFFVASDRLALLNSDLSTITLSIGDKTISVKAEGSGQVRNASLKKRADNSRRPLIPALPDMSSGTLVNARAFEDLLRQVSCSAQIRETKTEEDMKVNQVHFYSQQSCAVSNARFYGSCGFLPGLSLDLSIVSADLPAMKSFCTKAGDRDILVYQDKAYLYLSNPSSGAVLGCTRVASIRPPYQLLPKDGYDTIIHIDRDQLGKALQWATMVIEGTQRLSVSLAKSDDSTYMEFRNGQQDVSRFPIEIVQGNVLRADFPVRYFNAIIGYIEGDKVALKYGHKDASTILELSDASPDPERAYGRHFLQSMKDR